MFISAERFMYHFVRSIKSKDMVNFKDFFRKANVFIIDEVEVEGEVDLNFSRDKYINKAFSDSFQIEGFPKPGRAS